MSCRCCRLRKSICCIPDCTSSVSFCGRIFRCRSKSRRHHHHHYIYHTTLHDRHRKGAYRYTHRKSTSSIPCWYRCRGTETRTCNHHRTPLRKPHISEDAPPRTLRPGSWPENTRIHGSQRMHRHDQHEHIHDKTCSRRPCTAQILASQLYQCTLVPCIGRCRFHPGYLGSSSVPSVTEYSCCASRIRSAIST